MAKQPDPYGLSSLRKIAKRILADDTWGNEDGENYDPHSLAEEALAMANAYENVIQEIEGAVADDTITIETANQLLGRNP